jgi:CBS-domain-containing membrane protein
MKARDVMVAPVITVKPYSTVKEVAKTLVDRRISAVPVVDDAGKLVGIISEGDLMHRAETGTERRCLASCRLCQSPRTQGRRYHDAKCNYRSAGDGTR